MIRVKTFEEAADVVAENFFHDMQEAEFETFKEMAQCYWWEPQDIKEEVSSILTMETENAWMCDDLTHVVVNDDDIYYKDFKKMFLSRIKELSKMKNR